MQKKWRTGIFIIIVHGLSFDLYIFYDTFEYYGNFFFLLILKSSKLKNKLYSICIKQDTYSRKNTMS